MEPAFQGGLLQQGWFVALVGVVSLLFSAFFSGSETGFMSVSRARLIRSSGEETPARRRLLGLLKNLEDSILTCLIGTNLFNVVFSAVVTVFLTERYGQVGEWLALVIVATLVIILGEIVPKVLYREFPERMTTASVRPIAAAMVVLKPLRWVLARYTAAWRYILPAGEEPSRFNRGSLTALLMTNSVPSEHEQHFASVMDRFLRLQHSTLLDIMRPLAGLVTVGPEATVTDCLRIASSSGLSRLPVTGEDGRNLQGYLLVRDLLFLAREVHGLPVPRKLWRSFLLVDSRMSPYELFEELHSRGSQLAQIVGADGAPTGIITLEDLIETVMGSVHDEFDRTVESGKEMA